MAKILVVDDDPGIRKMLCKILSLKGHEIFLSPDPLNALTLIKTLTPDLIILDRIMPFADGDSLMLKIKKDYPAVKIIILTGHFDEYIKEKLILEGADLFISKAEGIDSIIEKINAFINSISSEESSKTRTMKILVVDDDENIRKLISKFIKEKKHIPYEAEDGLKAYSMVQNTDFDLIFLDIFMPNMNGEEFIEKIISLKPSTRIVIISGNETELLAKKMLEKGAIDYIKKPLNLIQIENILKMVSITRET